MEGLCYNSSQGIWCLTGPFWVCDRIDGIPSVPDVLMVPGPCLLCNNLFSCHVQKARVFWAESQGWTLQPGQQASLLFCRI